MGGIIERLARYLLTIRWLRVSQLYWFVVRRFLPPSNPAEVAIEAARSPLAVSAYPRIVQPVRAEFSFIGINKPIARPVNWHPEDQPRLWRYNLHYFDYLLWESFSTEQKASLIDDWIAANPMGTVNAWEPYTISLRIVNWAKYFDTLERVPDAWRSSLINQANWLLANLEYHILANHFLKNAKALIYAGTCFMGQRSAVMLRKGVAAFEQEVIEQILDDGGHYERSVMYHGIVLEDLLDVLNLAQAQPQLFSQAFVARLTDAAMRAARFLEDMLHGDGDIALFNDAALGIAPPPAELLAYAERVGNYERRPRPHAPVLIDKAASGYFGYRLADESFLIDCGDIAPDYQPGHGHCDMLSFELCLDGRRVVVDTGTYGYETDERRLYLRGTAAHNTVVVNGQNQSEVWGGFRVARRARPKGARVENFSATKMTFRGGHDGYQRLSQRVTHNRSFEIVFGESWEVRDSLQGKGEAEAASYLHFAPGLELRQEADGHWSVLDGERVILTVSPEQGCDAAAIETEYYPNFGVALSKATLRVAARGVLPLELGYRIARPAAKPLT